MAARYDLTIEQGATYRKTFRWTSDGVPVDLAGYKARMQIRRTHRSLEVLLEATTENGRFTISALAGEIHLDLSEADTAALPPRSAVFDIELVAADGVVTRLIEGDVTVTPEVTRTEEP